MKTKQEILEGFFGECYLMPSFEALPDCVTDKIKNLFSKSLDEAVEATELEYVANKLISTEITGYKRAVQDQQELIKKFKG